FCPTSFDPTLCPTTLSKLAVPVSMHCNFTPSDCLNIMHQTLSQLTVPLIMHHKFIPTDCPNIMHHNFIPSDFPNMISYHVPQPVFQHDIISCPTASF
ncbi:hypothetical protein Bpfe_016724, partial [Biomphalaria pfeifferi]